MQLDIVVAARRQRGAGGRRPRQRPRRRAAPGARAAGRRGPLRMRRSRAHGARSAPRRRNTSPQSVHYTMLTFHFFPNYYQQVFPMVHMYVHDELQVRCWLFAG